jgi:hypothetical protein
MSAYRFPSGDGQHQGPGLSRIEPTQLAADTAGMAKIIKRLLPGSSSPLNQLKLQDRRPVPTGSTKSSMTDIG